MGQSKWPLFCKRSQLNFLKTTALNPPRTLLFKTRIAPEDRQGSGCKLLLCWLADYNARTVYFSSVLLNFKYLHLGNATTWRVRFISKNVLNFTMNIFYFNKFFGRMRNFNVTTEIVDIRMLHQCSVQLHARESRERDLWRVLGENKKYSKFYVEYFLLL